MGRLTLGYRVDHVVDDDAVFAVHVPHDVHPLYLPGARPMLHLRFGFGVLRLGNLGSGVLRFKDVRIQGGCV